MLERSTGTRSARLAQGRFLWAVVLTILAFSLSLVFAPKLACAAADGPSIHSVAIPRVDHPPAIEDFQNMQPVPAVQDKLAKVEGFVQREPKDGQPATQRTVVYFGYDDKKLYIIFVAFDSQPNLIRARMNRRENIYEDDLVEVMLDSFHDQRRAFSFVCNPLGIQLDRLYTEGSGFDDSFDTLWDSQGKLTPEGYIVRMAIPFRSLRFPASGHSWGLIFQRIIPRVNENSFWPPVSSRINGRLNQEATLDGLERISPGRNIQVTPYGVLRSFRGIDNRDALHPFFEKKLAESRVGLESKVVIKDRLVVDLAVNPDFSQVESDEPQVTVNQRFEVFFPEKRQFFLENASYFETPVPLLFTRRIADPLFATRLTGKLGRYAIGALFADDRSPGKSVPRNNPLFGRRAYFGVMRVNRDIGKGSTLGAIFADREFLGEFNRVGGVDMRLKLGKNWEASAQALASSTQTRNGAYLAGPAYQLFVDRSSRKVELHSFYNDNSYGFQTRTGFFRRPGIRRIGGFSRYQFRPEGKRLVSHGPGIFAQGLWSHDGLRLEKFINLNYIFRFTRQTAVGVFANVGRDRLRPDDFSALTANRDYPRNHHGVFFETAFFKWLSGGGEAGFGTETNFVPATGRPVSARDSYFNGGLTLRPFPGLTIDNTYILTRLRSGSTGASIFNNHIIRSKWNYQFTRELSLRFITQYVGTLPNPQLTSLPMAKNLNFDILVTYLLHPGTALYAGYNSNLQNLDPALRLDPGDPNGAFLRTRNLATNDGRQLFIKLSYQFRF
jgi:hypothetical protein